MSVRIKFDSEHNAEKPTFVLASRKGKLIGKIPISNLQFTDCFNAESVARFDVYKSNISSDSGLWEQIKDFKLVWVRDWNAWFELKVDTVDNGGLVKNVTATSLGESELSQINLYNYQINTETDIEREDYEPTVLFNETKPSASLLHRIMAKAPHYTITHVDSTIASIQRTFSFDNKSIYAAFQDIAKEINCLFRIRCYSDANGAIIREIRVYDLETNCLSCYHRGEFTEQCEKCGSTDLDLGYGDDTTIFVSNENLANDITLTTDTGSVKNCFRLEAGDDLMTATIANCNPNGSPYIWYISDEVKSDMTTALVDMLNSYDTLYSYYQNENVVTVNPQLRTQYNTLITKYRAYSTDLTQIPETIVGYPNLMKEYYNTIDFYLFLHDTLMPNVAIPTTNAATEAAKLTTANLSPVAVQNLSSCSVQTASNAVIQMAKTIIDGRYQVKTQNENYSSGTWTGVFVVTSYSNEEDTRTTGTVSVTINDNYEKYVKQKIDKILSKQSEDVTDIVDLFKCNAFEFNIELKKYCLSRLSAFHECCQSCIDVLIEQGIADRKTWADKNPDLYTSLYVPYYDKLNSIDREMRVRESEIAVLTGTYDAYGDLKTDGMQTFLLDQQGTIQDVLNFENYLGTELWLEFSSYRREDTYSNDNYISDGLDNAELFDNALAFIEVAKKDIYKSATLQHSIKSSLKNLLAMKEFEPIVDYFEVGNWLRIKIDNQIFILRLIEYSVDYEAFDNISVTFSDVKRIKNGMSDLASIQQQAKSMATSYGSVARQAKKGKKGNDRLNDWVAKGLALTKMKIVDDADNQNISWDNHGILCKEYLPITDDYDKKQLKIINKGLYVTDDGWETSKAGIGNFMYYDPETGAMTEAYGVIADTLVGNLILGESVGVYNTKNSITLDENGMIITADGIHNGLNETVFTIRKSYLDGADVRYKNILSIDSNGNVILSGSTGIDSSNPNYSSVQTIDGIMAYSDYQIELSAQGLTSQFNETLSDYSTTTQMNSAISQTAREIKSTVSSAVNKYDTGSYAPVSSPTAANLGSYYEQKGSLYVKTHDAAIVSGKTYYTRTEYTIFCYGYGTPDDNGYDASDNKYETKYYLDQSSGKCYRCVGHSWTLWTTFPLITNSLSSEITQTADGLRGHFSSVIADYSTTSQMNSAIELSAQNLTLSFNSTLSDYSTTTQMNSEISATAKQIKMTVASAESKYDTTGKTIHYYGYGSPIGQYDASVSNKYYLDKNNGQIYKSNGSTWTADGTPLSLLLNGKVGKGSVTSELLIEPDLITLTSERLSISTTYFSLNKNGTITHWDSSNNKTELSNGNIKFYNGNTYYGGILPRTSAIYSTSNVGSSQVIDIESNQKGTILSNRTNWFFLFNNGMVPGGQRIIAACDMRIGDDLYLDDGIIFSNNGRSVNLFADGTAVCTNNDFHIDGDLTVVGTKNRVVETEHYGNVALNAMESANAVFSDMGTGLIDSTGICEIVFDSCFYETIEEGVEYYTFINRTSSGVIEYVEKYSDYFIVHGEPNTNFDWIVYAKQKGYADCYLDRKIIPKEKEQETDNSPFIGDDIPSSNSEQYMEEFIEDYDYLADHYLNGYEREVTEYDY